MLRQLGDSTARVMRWISDVEKTSVAIIAAGAFGAVVFSGFWLFVVGRCAGAVVSFVVLTIVLAMAGATVYLGIHANIIAAVTHCVGENCASLHGQADEATEAHFVVAFYAAIAMDIVVLLMLIFMRSRLRLAARTIQTACLSLGKRPMLYVFPLLPTMVVTLSFAFFVVVSA